MSRSSSLARTWLRRGGQVVEDRQGLPPGFPGLLREAGGAAGVAEVGESSGFAETVPEFPEDAEGVLVTRGCFDEAAELVLAVAEAVPGVCLAAAVGEFSVQGARACWQNVRARW